jgi:superfamily II DNA or RNA helicase
MHVRVAPDLFDRDLAEGLDRLSPADLAVAELKALVGEGLTKSAFFEIVRAVGPPTHDGRAWSTPKVNESVDRLRARRVLGGDGQVLAAWCERLILRVVQRPDGAALARSVRAAAPKSWREGVGYHYYGRRQWPYHDADLDRAIRLMALAGDEAEVDRLIAIAEQEATDDSCPMAMGSVLLRGLPSDPAFLGTLPPGLRDRIVASRLEYFLDHGRLDAEVEALIAAASDGATDWAAAPRLDRALMRLDILAERPDTAGARIARLRADDPVLALAGEAALAFLTGPEGSALPLFREALKRRRKATGKRKIALPGEFALYHALALFAADDAALLGEIAAVADAMETPAPLTAAALACLSTLVSGQDQEARRKAERLAALDSSYRQRQDPLGVAVTTLALAVADGANAPHRHAGDLNAADGWEGHAPLAERILAEIHTRFPAARQDRVEEWPRILGSLGEGYPRRFLEIVPIRPAWERALAKLEGFIAPPSSAPKAEPVAQTRRLVFRLNALTCEIAAIEQSAKGGGWTPGRPVALKRLRNRDPKLDYLTADDHRVVGAIKVYRTYYDESLEFDPVRGPLALVGHPRLFDAADPDQAIDLVHYPAELVVREDRDGITIDLSHRSEAHEVFIEPEAAGRWRLIEVTPALVELAGVLGPQGLELPRSARDRAVALIQTENPRLPVRSELAGVATDTVQGDPRPILRIAPEGDGFHLRAVVRPVGEPGPAYAPGRGARSVLVAQGAAHRRVERDLEAEAAALEAAAAAAPSLGPWREGDHDWRVEGLDAALEALQELHAYPGPIGFEWPHGTALKPTRTIGAKAMALNVASGKDWFEVKGEIAVDEDLVLDMAEVLARLGRAPGRFVPLDDGRFLALTEDLRRRLDAFAAATETTKGGQRIGAAGALALEDLLDAAGSVKADRRWTDLIERIEASRGYEPEIPPGFAAELRDYQAQGFVWLARLARLGLGACLADDMGLGKTIQTLALLLAEAAKGPSLVVAPTSVCHNWALEAARFAPDLRIRALAGAADRAAVAKALGPGDVLVVSYGLLHTEADLLAGVRFAVAVFDEAQNLKNAETRRAQASKRIDAAFRLALTGTPLENRLDELWSLFDTVTPGLLGSRERFQRRFSGPIERGVGAQARQALRTLVRPYLLRRTKAAVLTELPSRTEISVEVEPGPEERAFYEALRRRALEALATANADAGGQKRIRIFAEITRLRRAACNPALIDAAAGVESAKLAAVLNLADELRAGRHRALVFSQFTGHLDVVEAALQERGVKLLRLDGSTPAKERARRVEAFQAGEGDLFLISLKAGGSGLNLTGADYVVHLDPWWNPAVEDQATDRAHRIGQTRPVTVYRLVLKDSIEQGILSLHAAKRTLAADFLEDAEAAGALDEEALLALIRGEAAALGA